MKQTKSKLDWFMVMVGVIMFVFILPIGIFYIYRTIQGSIEGEFSVLSSVLISTVIAGICLFVLSIINAKKYIIVKGDKLTYYSVLRPFGKTLYFKDYIGKIIVEERASDGAYNVVYFIDENYRTVFKITGNNYRNFDEINNAVPLEVIPFNPSVKEYYKLLYLERITIKKNSINKGKNKNVSKLLVATQIIVVVGLLLLIIGYLLRWIFG